MKILAIFLRFRLILGVIITSAEGASENFGHFTVEQHDVILFKFQGGRANAGIF